MLRVHAAIERAVGLARLSDDGQRPQRRWSEVSAAGWLVAAPLLFIVVAGPAALCVAAVGPGTGRAVAIIVVECIVAALLVAAWRFSRIATAWRAKKPARPATQRRVLALKRRALALIGESMAVAARNDQWEVLELTVRGAARQLHARQGLRTTNVAVTAGLTALVDQFEAVNDRYDPPAFTVTLERDGTTTFQPSIP